MFYRVFASGIVVFWLVMTILLIKRNHFPETLSHTPVPTSLVIDTFFGQERPGGQFDLFQNNRELGIVTIIPRERKTPEGITREIVLWNGGSDIRIRWNAHVTLSQDSSSVAGFELDASIIGTEIEVEIRAKPDAAAIDYVVRKGDEILADSKVGSQSSFVDEQTATTILATMGFKTEKDSGESPSGEFKTYEQTIEINGRQREVYTLVASLGPGREVTAHFNRSGEILAIYSFFDFELRPAAIILDP